MRIDEQTLQKIIGIIIEAGGSEAHEAAMVAEHLVKANLLGHDSHGVGMVPMYIQHISEGWLKPNMPAKLIKEDGAILVFDGQRGYGQRTAHEAMNAAIDKCKETGLALMSLRNAHHIGRVGAYGEQSIKAGIVSLHFVNVIDHDPIVVPFGGRESRFTTNPVCMAMPGTDYTDPILLDMATSVIPIGKARVAMNAGKAAPEGALLDAEGNPTTDPNVVFSDPRGALIAFGLHKGYGIALFCELLAGALGGGGTIQPGNQRLGSIVNNMLVFLIDPGRLVNIEWMRHEIDDFIVYIKEAAARNPENPVMVAGDPERKSLRKRLAAGIPLSSSAWERILKSGEAVGIERRMLEQLLRTE